VKKTAALRAREATGLTMRAFAKLIGAAPSSVSRWEKGTLKMNGPTLALMRLILASPDHAQQVLAGEDQPGFTGDGGPPPARRDAGWDGRAMVDEYGNPLAEGERPEPDLGFEPGAFEVEVSPEFTSSSEDDEPSEDGEDGGDPDEVPSYRPSF